MLSLGWDFVLSYDKERLSLFLHYSKIILLQLLEMYSGKDFDIHWK